MSEEANDKGRSSGWGTWAALLLATLLLYVLSVGPAALVIEKTGAGDAVAGVVYAPLIWLRDHTALREPMDDYVVFWFRVGGVGR